MLVRASSFTVDLGENGYLIGFTDEYEYPAEMPFGWRCGPATDEANAVVLTTTDTGPLHLTVQIHNAPPPPESGDWEPAEEMSLLTELPALCLATLEQGDILDAWPPDNDPLDVPPSDSGNWVRMRLYCHAADPEPGIGDHGERHLVQFWPAPQTPPVHPDITEADRQARAEYAADQALPVDDYTVTYPDVH
ncbi:hypothetical protein AB0945_41375 [Streptomyces sp. NPDC005474]|uniref:hypothetical protein n=1 Tax=Streptomyces sp. NPDC005474 TaxID=3154878 RepID=UPI00345479BB